MMEIMQRFRQSAGQVLNSVKKSETVALFGQAATILRYERKGLVALVAAVYVLPLLLFSKCSPQRELECGIAIIAASALLTWMKIAQNLMMNTPRGQKPKPRPVRARKSSRQLRSYLTLNMKGN